MSIVIAKKTKDGFIFAGDSQATCGSRKETVVKIFKARKEDNMYIGVVGTLRDCELLKVADGLLDVNAIRREELNEESLIEYTIPQLRKILKENDRYLTDKDGTCSWDSSIIIVYKDKAFNIDHDFTVTEIDDFKAIGSPQDFATGAYEILKESGSKLSDYDTVKNIIKTVIAKNEYVGYPIRIIDTGKDKDFTEINAKLILEEIETKPSKKKADRE